MLATWSAATAPTAASGGAGIPFEGGAYPQTFVLADLEVDGELEPRAAHAFLGARGMLFFFPLGRPASWRMLGMRPRAGAASGERAGRALARRSSRQSPTPTPAAAAAA